MADTNKKEYTSNLHPKGDMDTTVYPNVKSENIIDKDTTAYTAGKVPDSSLVSKSLDGISENLETTKIQVATNKKNIETLQGNYTGLQYQVNTNSSDIALTKTQVETNKTNIAKNTQDIENLSAVMPTDINVDANGYAVLEHDGTEITGQTKKVKFAQTDKTASFSEVTIPTASALKTKDGTSFGGGDESSIPTDINVDSDFNLVLEHDGKVITGQKKLLKLFKYAENGDFVYDKNIYIYNSSSEKYKEFKYIFDSYGHRVDNGGFHYYEDEQNSDTYYSGFNIYIKSSSITNPYSLGFLITKNVKANTCIFKIKYTAQNNSNIGRALTLPNKSGTISLVEDLDAKQSKLYRHTIEIVKDNEATLILTTESTISTEINTMDKFISAFKGSELACMCALNDANAWNIHFIGIQVGTTINDTSMMSTNLLDTALTFTDVFGTSGYEMVDKVTAM